MCHCFALACDNFDMKISLSKTVAFSLSTSSSPSILKNETKLKTVDKYVYLDSSVNTCNSQDDQIGRRTGMASATFGLKCEIAIIYQ